ncbi:MAG: prolipoprotein diacylglyceryl transferase, partial [Armatimonadetes bacterium]|nr:prolipoprotein diacylglyceryl transferase [Armatimonadota bacterium]
MYPVLFSVGSLPIHAWGVLLMIGFLVGTWRAAKVAPRYGIPGEDLWDAALFGLLGGILGARFAYVLQNLGDYTANPLAAFALWQGGMTSFGGLIGGVTVGLWILHRRGHSLLDAGDLVAPSLALGYLFGRIGCYLNGCCYGGYCPEPLGVHFPEIPGTVHATQLYSAFAGLAIFFALAVMESRRTFAGQILALFALLYGVYRFV